MDVSVLEERKAELIAIYKSTKEQLDAFVIQAKQKEADLNAIGGAIQEVQSWINRASPGLSLKELKDKLGADSVEVVSAKEE